MRSYGTYWEDWNEPGRERFRAQARYVLERYVPKAEPSDMGKLAYDAGLDAVALAQWERDNMNGLHLQAGEVRKVFRYVRALEELVRGAVAEPCPWTWIRSGGVRQVCTLARGHDGNHNGVDSPTAEDPGDTLKTDVDSFANRLGRLERCEDAQQQIDTGFAADMIDMRARLAALESRVTALDDPTR